VSLPTFCVKFTPLCVHFNLTRINQIKVKDSFSDSKGLFKFLLINLGWFWQNWFKGKKHEKLD
jgi:hypothetical protein